MATDRKFVVKNGLQAQNIDFVDSTTATPTATLTASMNAAGVLSFDSGTLEIDGANNTVNIPTLKLTSSIEFEGATDDANETTLTVVDPTADRTITLPDATGTVATIDNSQTFSAQQTFSNNIVMDGGNNRIYFDDVSHNIYMEGSDYNLSPAQEYWRVYVGGTQALSAHNINSGSNYVRIGTGFDLQFEGATSNSYETTVTVTDPTADRTITLPDANGDVVLNESGSVNISSTADGGPVLNLISNDHSDAADFNQEGAIKFIADNDADQATEYARIYLATGDVTDGTEDGWLYYNGISNGTLYSNFAMSGSGSFYILSNATNNPVIEWNATGGTAFDVQLRTATPTADRTITLPDATGTAMVRDSSGVVYGGSSQGEMELQGSNPRLRLVDNNSGSNFQIFNTSTSDDTYTIEVDYGNSTANSSLRIRIDTEDVAYFDTTGLLLNTGNILRFEGSTADNAETTLTVVNPTADRTISLPDATGTVLLTDGDGSNLTGIVSEVLDDTTPQLGGDLDVNGKDFTSSNGIFDFTTATASTTPTINLIPPASHFDTQIKLHTNNTGTFQDIMNDSGVLLMRTNDNNPMYFYTNGTSRLEILGSGTINLKNEARFSEDVVITTNQDKVKWTTDANGTHIKGNSSTTHSSSYIQFWLQSASNSSSASLYIESTGIMLPTAKDIRFEGSTSDSNETTLTVVDPTADRTITLPNATGTVLTTGNSDTPTTTTSSSDADFVLIDDGGTMKKITPTDLGIGSGGGGGSASAYAMIQIFG